MVQEAKAGTTPKKRKRVAAKQKKKQKKKAQVWLRDISEDELDTERSSKKFLLRYARKLIEEVYGDQLCSHQ